MYIHLYGLKVFSAVVEKKSFSEAAANLHITQLAVSLQIKSLEEYFNTRLLNRTRSGVKLTEPGGVLFKYAKQFSKLDDEFKYEMSSWNGV